VAGPAAMCDRSDLFPKQAVRILRLLDSWCSLLWVTQMALEFEALCRLIRGSPSQIFRKQEGNFYKAVLKVHVERASRKESGMIYEPDEIMTVEQVAKYLKLKPQDGLQVGAGGTDSRDQTRQGWRFRRRILDEWIDTSIQLSRAGFDLMFSGTLLAVRHQGISEEDLEKLLKEAESGR